MPNDIPDIMAFDMRLGEAAPYPGFGDVVQDSPQFERELRAEAAEIRQEIRSTFGVKLESSVSIPGELDDIVENMWGSDWDPRVNDLNLFTRSFGMLLTEATLELLGGRPIFRGHQETESIFKIRIIGPELKLFHTTRPSNA